MGRSRYGLGSQDFFYVKLFKDTFSVVCFILGLGFRGQRLGFRVCACATQATNAIWTLKLGRIHSEAIAADPQRWLWGRRGAKVEVPARKENVVSWAESMPASLGLQLTGG